MFLRISEMFHSLQGEGPFAGKPAVFLRLAGCNLTCQGFSYKHPVTKEHLGCDTKHVWRYGKAFSNHDILNLWMENGWLNKLRLGAHLVVTGGEPTLQQEALCFFLKELKKVCEILPFCELETNATRLLLPEFAAFFSQINASPKLSYNGDTRDKTYYPEVLSQLAQSPTAIFKFVVARKTDSDEIFRDFVKPFNIDPQRVWLMPEGGTEEAIKTKASMVAELCKQHGMNYSPRLHITIWGEVTGV